MVFYDNSASEIRLIQRSGRTGRSGKGKIVFLYTKGTIDELSLWKGKSKKESMRTKLGGAPLKKSKKRKKKRKLKPSQDPNYGIPSPGQTTLTSSPSKIIDSNMPSVKIHVTPSKQFEYQISDALPVHISPISVSNNMYDLAIPSGNPFIGIDLVPASYIDMNITNLSLFRQIARKKQAVPHYLIFVDACEMDPSTKDAFKESVVAFRKYTGIPVNAFTDHSILHLTLHKILSTYLKNNPE